MHWFNPVSLVLLIVAVASLGAVVTILWEFIRFSSRDPLTRYAPDERSARARRWAGVYVRRPDELRKESSPDRDRHLV